MNLRYLKSAKAIVDFDSDVPMWDVFVSAYNESDRVRVAFEKIRAKSKLWILLPEYGYTQAEIAHLDNPVICAEGDSESVVVKKLFDAIGLEKIRNEQICIDITGFMRPQIMFMVKLLQEHNVRKFAMAYTEPERYSRQEHTTFSNEEITTVRQVHGFEGLHADDMSDDLLVVGIGYDDALISRVVNDKDSARLVQMLSLPSLSADMYQESILRLDRTGASTADSKVFFAPANDPFVVASELSDKYSELLSGHRVSNLYLCPLATKPQALGFSLFYLSELQGNSASIVFPFSRRYERETSSGIGRTWLYRVEI
jgi:hypothetical protein